MGAQEKVFLNSRTFSPTVSARYRTMAFAVSPFAKRVSAGVGSKSLAKRAVAAVARPITIAGHDFHPRFVRENLSDPKRGTRPRTNDWSSMFRAPFKALSTGVPAAERASR